ncbi:MAG: hypothetical protein JO092_00970 [Candidatus Eremiobacteraeota bacterium]|nr:hypothetical protein [Candidatus Eremiobacteraeota bacterium]MBV8374386.1 hypothetical protein [Candidatus Eremiobacteraeota bacterium]
MIATLLAGVFLAVFGACGAWFLTTRFPSARFLQAGYALMSLAGVFFVVWALVKNVTIGIAATALLGFGGAIGVFGALRKELRGR